MTRTSTSHRSFALAALLAATVAVAGTACTDVSVPEQARAEISGPDGTQVRVITSTDFIQGEQSSPDPTVPDTGGIVVRMFSADTVQRTLPTTVNRSLTETRRIHVQVTLQDSAASSPVEAELQLLVDGEEKARASGDLFERALRVSFTSFVSG